MMPQVLSPEHNLYWTQHYLHKFPVTLYLTSQKTLKTTKKNKKLHKVYYGFKEDSVCSYVIPNMCE